MKWKVLIVEDDVNFRFAIKELIDWEHEGLELAGEAIHGKQALEILAKKHVDIVLTDMSMPQMNGVELTKQIRILYPDIIVIALSAYDDFGFVRNSMKNGAKDYILKQEMNSQEIIRVIKRCCKDKQDDFDKSKRENEFIKLLQKKTGISEGNERYFINIFEKNRYVLFAVDVHLNDVPGFETGLQEENKVLYHAYDKAGNLYVVFGLEKTGSQMKIYDRIRKYARDLERVYKDYRVFASNPKGSIELLGEAYLEIQFLREIQTYFQDRTVFMYQDTYDIRQNRENGYNYMLSKEANLLSEEGIENEMHRMCEILYRKMPDTDHVNQAFTRFYLEYRKRHDMSEHNDVRIYDELQRLQYIGEKKDYILGIIQNQRGKTDRKYSGDKQQIEKAQLYIREHYMEDISLAVISQYVGLSENYFSNLFKAETGENLTKYINKVRIEKAKILMDSTNMKVYEIAEQVGYKNATYFSTIFKRITHMSISEYKKTENHL